MKFMHRLRKLEAKLSLDGLGRAPCPCHSQPPGKPVVRYHNDMDQPPRPCPAPKLCELCGRDVNEYIDVVYVKKILQWGNLP